MELLFMTSMEKRVDEERSRVARISVGQRQGKWQIVWSEPDGDGRMQETMWFDGAKWDEMLAALRSGLQSKMLEGYAALLDIADLRERSRWDRSRKSQHSLHYYADRHAVPELYDKLKVWRRSQAGKENIAPYIIASNRLLQMIGAFVPHSLDELRQLPGFGDSRIDKYGQAILEITGAFERTTTFPLDWVDSRVDASELSVWSSEQRQQKERDQHLKHAKRVGLLSGIAAGERMDILAERLSIPRRDLIRDIEQLDKEGYDVDPIVETELAEVEAGELQRAEALFSEKGDRLLKPIVEKLFTPEELKQQDVNRLYEWLRLLRIRRRRLAAEGGSSASDTTGEAIAG